MSDLRWPTSTKDIAAGHWGDAIVKFILVCSQLAEDASNYFYNLHFDKLFLRWIEFLE